MNPGYFRVLSFKIACLMFVMPVAVAAVGLSMFCGYLEDFANILQLGFKRVFFADEERQKMAQLQQMMVEIQRQATLTDLQPPSTGSTSVTPADSE